MSEGHRVRQFLNHHPNPEGIVADLRAATAVANVGRDLSGVEPARAHGAGQGVGTQLCRSVAAALAQ